MDYKEGVTFIIPTLGRYSLHKALDSLRQQTNARWKALVIFDNHDITIPTDEQISAFRFEKPPNVGAGIVRNSGLTKVDTEWTAFLDDDDWLDRSYVEKIFQYGQNYDLIHFTYHDAVNNNTQPPKHINQFEACHFGISFAVRTKFIHDNLIQFAWHAIEDYQFIMDCINAGARPIITHEVLYMVGGRGEWRT